MVITVLLVSGASYGLLYMYFWRELLPVLHEWKDFQFHYHVITLVQDQSKYIPSVNGRPVLYPLLFHHCVGTFSSVFHVPIESGMLIFPLVMWTGSTLVSYLLIRELLQNDYAGFFSLLFLGLGATIIILGTGTVFFGKAFIFPINYLIAGFLPHIMAHFFGLLLLYLLITTRLRRNFHSILGGGIGALLILTHFLAAVTYAIAVLCLCISDRLTVNSLTVTRVSILVVIAVLITGPWWGDIGGELMEDPYPFLVGDASKTWEGGMVSEIIDYYGVIPLFSLIGTYFFIKSRSIGIFLFLWSISLFILVFTRWGARFALECALPLNILGAIGLTYILLWVRKSKRKIIFRIGVLILIIILLFDNFYIFKLL